MTMSVYEKCHTNNDVCKNNAPRREKDNINNRSVCPSKLSKRELEDLYYSLLENNLELKKTINAQNEKNKILSTKVRRMTAQNKTYLDSKDCCAAGKAVINEQKAVIADLTKANEAMVERVRRLSTQLCSAKQFLKQNPNARHCYKCYINTTSSVKNLSRTSLHNKMSDVDLKSLAPSARPPDGPVTRTVETNTSVKDVENVEKGDAEKICNENKCRTTMENFQQKIEELEEELAKTHEEYSNRMTQLENQVSQLQATAVRARSEQSTRARDEAFGLARGLRDASADKAELETLLTIEKKRVTELEMRLKAAELSQQVAKTIEVHRNAANRLEEKQLCQTSIQRFSVSTNLAADDDSPRRVAETTSNKRLSELTVPEDKLSKSDDSGYADHRRDSYSDEKGIDKTNQELMKKINELQAQLDAIKSYSDKRDKAEVDASSYCKSPIICDKNWDNELKTKQLNMIPERPQISIFEPETMTAKKPNSAQTDITSTISKLERNDLNKDERLLQNAGRELDYSFTKQTVETSVSTRNDHKSTGCCGKGENKENDLDPYSSASKNIAKDDLNKDARPLQNAGRQLDISVTQPVETNVSTHKDHCTGCFGKSRKKENELDSYTLASKNIAKDDLNKDSKPLQNAGRELDYSEVSTQKDHCTECCGQDRNKKNELNSCSSTAKNIVNDDLNIDSRSIQNARREDYSVAKQAVETNLSTHKDDESTECCGKGKIQENRLESYSPASKDATKDEDDVSESKSNRVSQVIFKSQSDKRESQEINLKTSEYSSPEKLSSRCPSFDQTPKSSTRKADDNYQQIPGPLPISRQQSELSKKVLADNWKKARNYGKLKSRPVAVAKDSACRCSSSLKNNQDKLRSGSKDINYDDDNDITNDATTKRLMTGVQSSEGSKIAQRKTVNDSFKQSIQEKQIQRNVEESATPSVLPTNMKDDRKISKDRLESKTFQLDRSIKPGSNGTNKDLDRINELDICLERATICNCPEKPGSSMSVFRSCSGTMTVTSVSPKSRFRRCTCGERPARNSCGYVLRDAPIGTSTPKTQNRTATQISPQTYTVDSEGKRSRATSPDNTDNEISGMSDLPTEKEATTPRDALSPGEHKTTPTTTESYSFPNEMTLSEGEVPVDKYRVRGTSKSVGEASSNDYPMKDNSLGEHKSSSEKMEAALQAISQELARCRWLLQSQRTREQLQCKDVASCLDCACDSLILLRNRRISRNDGTKAPTCLFILHISTIVLAEEVVIRSRDARFILTWKFFDSDNTVTHMGVGRVLNFHFCTQYYVELTRDVVNYLSNEDMLVMMWEVGSTEKPFATCALPLKQVLIKTNKMVDLALPLRAGPYLTEKSNIFNNSGDIGVLEAWCMLYCDRMDLPFDNRNLVQLPPCEEPVLEITVLWLTLNVNCEAMLSNDARRLYVAYEFLGRDEAELETPVSLPKPKHATDKCIFNFRKCFNLTDTDMRVLEYMVSCRSQGWNSHSSKNCIVFTVVSEPPKDPLGLENCEDIGFAFLYFGDLLAYSRGDSLREMLPVCAAQAPGEVCGGLAVQVDGLHVLRALKQRT